MSHVEVHDRGWLKALKAIRNLDGRGVEVGVDNTAKYPDGTPVAMVAAIQQVKYRWFTKVERRWKRYRLRSYLKRIQQAINAGRDPEPLILELGKAVEADQRKSLKRHGLVDTGTLIGSIESRPRRDK